MNAPKTASFRFVSMGKFSAYRSLIDCVSHAVSPTNTMMPTTDTTNWSALDTMKRFTRLAITTPIRPIMRKEPIEERSRRVVYPYRLVAPNITAAIKNVLAILVPVKTRKIDASESPMTAQKIQNNAWAVVADIDLMRPANNKANGSGARMTTHFKGVEKIGT